MQKNKLKSRYLRLLVYAAICFSVHLAINFVWPFLTVSEIAVIHASVLGLYAGVYYLSNLFKAKKPQLAPMITFGGISLKMILALFIILILYLVKENNKEAFVFSFLAAYLIYLPLISYFYIRDLK